ncbi:Abnormal long morphology protein 1 [Operophtera brumata]|uniref:Abnormal long morphology protein 1 n=1 Tax=Operophtera brumata TaxID=104452 RepID=A0A0L7KZ62_OPEBR|nr:Abnormal long morphology protein 1 [Operophtera brumata]
MAGNRGISARKHLVFSTDPESVKDEFAFDNPGFRQEERHAWQHDAPTLPLGGKQAPLGGKTAGGKPHVLQAEFTKPEQSKDDTHLQRARVRHVKLWARDFTGLGFRCGGGARDGLHVHSVLRSGPAAAARLQPGDKIKSIKIEFTGTPLEDAVGILSLASPYPVELEIVEGGRVSGAGRAVHHPLLKRAGSTGDVSTLEKEAKLLHPPKSPNTSHSNNSTLENKPKTGIKKIITDKIITSTTLERNKKEKKDITTLERENEKNVKLANKTRYSDVPAMNKPERNKNRHSTGSDVQIIVPDNNGIAHQEHAEVQKKDYDPKRGMKFGIRVLPPNVPDDGVLKHKNVENGVVAVERKSLDEIDKPEPQRAAPTSQIKHESEVEQKKPVVAKRREKMAPPIPNARVKTNESDVSNISLNRSDINTSRTSEISLSTFERNDLNSSGIKRDENGIPQELPQHMMDAARAARSNRKSSADLVQDKVRPEGKAPSPPDAEKNKTDDSIIEQLQNVNDFLSNEKQHSSLLYDSFITSPNTSTTSASYINTSTPKVNKTKSVISNLSRAEESINFSQDDIDDIVTKPFRRENDSLNNFFEDSKSNLSSNQDGQSIMSFNHSDKSEKGSTTIELNNSDITIHSSPLNDTVHSASDDTSLLDENERKAQSLGDLSRFELRAKTNKPSTGTLERAQSLDISAEEAEIQENTISPKKRKAMSVVETTFFESSNDDVLPDMVDSDKGMVNKHKEPRLSLNLAKNSAMEGLSTFQRNRLKKGSEFGNLEDAIVKGSNSSIESERIDEIDSSNKRNKNFELYKGSEHETSDHLARRIMDENLKVHLKLVSEFAKSTSDGSNASSLDSSQEAQPNQTTAKITKTSPTKYEEKLTILTDTNIPDDVKVSRNTYVNSLERPKSEMMKKLLAKNPILNVHIDQGTQKTEASTSSANKESSALMTDNFKSLHQPDIVNFDLKPQKEVLETKTKDYDDFVSNIRVGSNNNSFNHDKKPIMTTFKSEWSEPKQTSTTTNVVTITTEKNKPEEQKIKSYTKSIEIGEPMMRVMPPDVLEGIRRHGEKEKMTLYMEPANMSVTMTQEPVQKTVTVNTAEDEFGNKVITQNVEKISTKYITTKAEAPLQVEQFSFGIVRNPGEIDELTLEEGDVKDIDRRVLDEIKRQNPNMHFTTDDPAYTRTETIILNTKDMDEEQAKALMAKLQNNPSFMAQKTPEELSNLGIRIIQDLEDVQTSKDDAVELTKTRYSINPARMAATQRCTRIEGPETHKEHITEIQVVTPRTEIKQKSEVSKDKLSSRQRAPLEEPPLSYELDVELLNDFILNERHHSAKQQDEANKRTKPNNESKKRHSDFDLPRNSHIKFRTATYESPKGTIVTSTDLENRRLSQLDQQLRVDQAAKPVLLAKPSSIPVKSEKTKALGVGVSSKIPIFSTQKSLSQENLSESRFSLPRSPPPQFSSSGNISVTSIKSSSRSPSGGKMS